MVWGRERFFTTYENRSLFCISRPWRDIGAKIRPLYYCNFWSSNKKLPYFVHLGKFLLMKLKSHQNPAISPYAEVTVYSALHLDSLSDKIVTFFIVYCLTLQTICFRTKLCCENKHNQYFNFSQFFLNFFDIIVFFKKGRQLLLWLPHLECIQVLL